MTKTEIFIEKAISKNGDVYDYSKVEYINSNSKVILICKEHGEFLTKPNTHLNGKGCWECGVIRRSLSKANKNWLNDFVSKHGDLYDYSKVEYINNRTKVDIICKEHGEFSMSPNSHLNGCGCPKCGIIKLSLKNSNSDWLKSFISVHGDLYDYSKVEYINNRTKVNIICKKHGSFLTKPNTFLNGSGCPKCGYINIGLSKVNNNWLNDFVSKHGDLYDYSKVKYITNSKKVEIICKEHGSFLISPNSHLSGSGCPKCGHINIGLSKVNNNWLNDFVSKHGDLYDYSNVKYINNKIKVEIICKEHGSFLLRPNCHLNGKGCKKCSSIKTSEVRSSKTWLNDFVSKHGDLYDYSNVKYINNRIKVEIICKKHGSFLTSPNSHLNGSGCPTCNISKGEWKIKNILESINLKFITQYKFDDCVSHKNSKLKFDFYLPDINLCIEYDGIQHFKPIERFGGQDALNDTIIRDNIKNKYCFDNNIKLIRIPYTDFDKIEEIILETF